MTHAMQTVRSHLAYQTSSSSK